MDIRTKFDISDKVIINGDGSVVATIQRITISKPGIGGSAATYEVAWFDSSGNFKEHWMFEWQLDALR